MTHLDPMRTFGARLALAREQLHEAHRQRRQKRAEVDAMLAAAGRAIDEELREWGRVERAVRALRDDIDSPVPYVPTLRAYWTDDDRRFLRQHGVTA